MTHIAPERAAGARVALYSLTFVSEGDQVVIGRPDIDSFGVFSADAAAVVRRLQAGESIAAVSTWYQAMYGEPADVDDFLATLRGLAFIRPDQDAPGRDQPGGDGPGRMGVDGDRSAGERTACAAVRPIRLQRLALAVFSAPAMLCYAAAAAAAVYLAIRVPALRPGPSKVFFGSSLLIIACASFAAEIIGIAWHEAFHVLAGRRLGLTSKLSVGRRLYFVVFQTTLAGLMGVPARKRILPLCAGLLADALCVSGLIGLAAVSMLASWPSRVAEVAAGLAYLTILRMLWQFMIFMETDLCHVLASVLRCPDLHAMTRAYLRNRWWRSRRRADLVTDESGWTARDVRIVRRYAPLVALGSMSVIGIAVFGVIPLCAGLAIRFYRGVASGGLTSPRFWDSTLVAALFLTQFAVIGALAIRDRRRRVIPPGSRLTAADDA